MGCFHLLEHLKLPVEEERSLRVYPLGEHFESVELSSDGVPYVVNGASLAPGDLGDDLVVEMRC